MNPNQMKRIKACRHHNFGGRRSCARCYELKALREDIAQKIEAFGLLPSDETTQEEVKMFHVMRRAAAEIARGNL